VATTLGTGPGVPIPFVFIENDPVVKKRVGCEAAGR